MYAIEKNVAIPDARITPRTKQTFPFHEMEVGDSFLVPFGDTNKAKLCRNVACRVWATNARYRVKSDQDVGLNGHGVKVLKEFTRRYISKKVQDGVRVWRIA